MAFKNTLTTYGSIAKTFHWMIALLIVCLLAVGLYMTEMELSPDRFKVYGLHKSFGITVLALAVLRALWRAGNVRPALPTGMKHPEKFGAHASHFLLYLCMFLMPLTGWAMTSSAGFPVSVFGWFVLPDLVPVDKVLNSIYKAIHACTAYGFIALICVHAGAALWHHFIRRDDILRRMLPGGKNHVETR